MKRFCVFREVSRAEVKPKQVIDCRWVFKRKTDCFGRIVRWRARLVAKGFAQREWDSYSPDEISSPVAHKQRLRTMLSVCTALNMEIRQLDIKAAFLQSDLTEKIYLRMPPDRRVPGQEDRILELSRAIYGLKQASASFYGDVSAKLKSMGFKATVGDPCLFERTNEKGK